MVIEKIIKQLTPERIKEENDKVLKLKLPSEIQKWIKEYEKVGEKVGERKDYIWKWTYLNMQNLTLPTVIKKYRNFTLNKYTKLNLRHKEKYLITRY